MRRLTPLANRGLTEAEKEAMLHGRLGGGAVLISRHYQGQGGRARSRRRTGCFSRCAGRHDYST